MSRLNNPYPFGPGNLPKTFHMRKNVLATKRRRTKHDVREQIKRILASGAKPVLAGNSPLLGHTDEVLTARLHEHDDEKRALLQEKTVDELRAICKAQNVKGYSKMKKADLVEAALA